jgi:zinc protease
LRAGAAEIRFEFQTHVLENGLRVILHEDHSSPLVSVHIMYHVGSKDERKGRTGFAHLFEHLLFQGSRHVGETEHFRYVQGVGGTLNGSTWFDRTNYFQTLPSNNLDLALWLESDRMGFFLPAITQEKLDNQRGVVKNERRQSYENRPYGLAVETVLRNTYPEGHPYRHPTIGFMEDLDAASLDDVRAFFEMYYAPNNAVLVLAGDLECDDALQRVGHYFGEVPARKPPPAIDTPVPPPPGERRAVLEDRVQVPRVYMTFHAPSFRHPEFEASGVLASLLADGESSRLYRRLVYEKKIAGEVHAFVWPLELVGMLWVVATARPGVTAAELETEVSETLDSLLTEGPAEDELLGARNRARRRLVRNLAGVGGRSDALAHAAVLRGDPEYVNEAFARYAEVGEEDIRRSVADILRPENRSVLWVVPAEAA